MPRGVSLFFIRNHYFTHFKYYYLYLTLGGVKYLTFVYICK